MITASLLALLVAAVTAHVLGRASARRTAGSGIRLQSTANYYGLLPAGLGLIAGLACLLAVATWRASSPFAAALPAVLVAAIAALVIVSGKFTHPRLAFEKLVTVLLVAASVVAILTTAGIFASVAVESWLFFREVGLTGFLFGTKWAPTGAPASFGVLPLLAGTLLITVIAVAVATPLGLLSAIYMAEYANPKTRAILKPMLEMLAGIPTVVLGFFAALTAAPAIRTLGQAIGLDVASESALAAGLVMGMMIVPLVSSLSDDIINAVPQSLRDGSYAMGATKSETIKRVVFPAALPGIVAAIMLAISRAIGETMIVVMAAGLAANLSLNPLAAVSTITVQIATLLVGDQEFDSAKTLSAFALGLLLFLITLALNFIALRVVQKYREQYD
jgi:phosphate transport system permease protein